jgi:alkylhydroperoxidase/carboxymuconolactone decarboxylase family protein YurZ
VLHKSRCHTLDGSGSIRQPVTQDYCADVAELLSIAFDASITHMYAPGTRRHIKAALKLGATMEEIMEVLKICVAEGVQASNLGVPILAEELANRSAVDPRP